MQETKISFLDRVLLPPRYGFKRDGKFYKPTHQEIFAEFFFRLNFITNRKHWLGAFSWLAVLALCIIFFIFVFNFFSWKLFSIGMVYSMVALGSHGTFWLHRYSTHRAFQFRFPLIREICKNLVIRVIPDEIYVISHHVHHRISEQAGDPYNVHGGWLYCFLADMNHQAIHTQLSEKDYEQVTKIMSHTGVHMNSYTQYMKWGSVCHPFKAISHYLINWTFWYGAFYWMGGHALATAILGCSAIWAVGVRTYNYDGHGRGKDRRQDGIDFNRDDWSVNQVWPGYVAGEWHNNHHLYPSGARSGFLGYQIDLPWYFIRFLEITGQVVNVKDYKSDFIEKYYRPYLAEKNNILVKS